MDTGCAGCPSTSRKNALTPLEPQSRFGDKLPQFQVVCPQNGTAVLKGLKEHARTYHSAAAPGIHCRYVGEG